MANADLASKYQDLLSSRHNASSDQIDKLWQDLADMRNSREDEMLMMKLSYEGMQVMLRTELHDWRGQNEQLEDGIAKLM